MTYSQGTTSYNFAFDYISKYYVKVRINNNDELTYGTHYTIADKTVTLNSAVTLSEGDLIEIFRETPTDKTVEWYDSSILRAQDLNLFNVQLMHINEENMDKLLDSGIQEDKLDSKWDARLKPIKNLANATEDDEAINYGFLKSTQNGYLQASKAKVDEAASKAKDAMIQANRAYEQAETAKQNSTNAYNEANRAYSEAERAKGYADKAKTSEDNVSAMKASVEATKTEADNIKKEVEATKTATVNAIKDAQAAATNAATKAYQAATSATNAANSATNATNSATEAANSATEAKTYKDQAKAIVGGDFLTTTDASKAFGTHNTDPAAHPDKLVNLTTNGNSLRAVKGNGTNVDVVVPYAVDTTQANPKNLGNYTTNKISDIRDLFNNELADMNTKGCSVRFIRLGADLSTIYNNWAKNWDATMSPWGTIYGTISLLSDSAYANVELVGYTGTTVLLQRIASNWKTAETKVYTNGMLNVADTLKLQSNELTLDMDKGTQTNINIGLTPKNYSGSGFNYTFYNGKNSLADIVAKTQAVTDNSNNVATTAFVQSTVANKVSQLVNSAPETLDTLNELANALGNDPNFATTVSTQIGQKANIADVYTKSYIDNLVNTLYPVGIIVEFFNSVDPNTVWVGTTWERMEAGRVLISSGQYSESDYSHNYTLGETGGEATHTLTVDELPAHTHNGEAQWSGEHQHSTGWGENRVGPYGNVEGNNTNGGSGSTDRDNFMFKTSANGGHTHSIVTNEVGGNAPHSIVQPYIVVNRWKRTA